MVLVVVRPEQLVQGYFETTIANGNEPDGRSLLRFGSVSKPSCSPGWRPRGSRG